METMTHKSKAPLLPHETDASLRTTSNDAVSYDIVSVGFGPAALAIAIAMRESGLLARVLFLEKQTEFGWHTGMLLPGTKMQISFIKDLATLRNPRSQFTFLNYLHQNGRLVHFTNLSTHTPFREEFNDYMKWCASHFNEWVRYGQEVISIAPAASQGSSWAAESFRIIFRDTRTGQLHEVGTKNVIVANGRKPAVPAGLSSRDEQFIVHSSAYMNTVPKRFRDSTGHYHFAVVGGGQSAVEISDDLLSRYPNAKVHLVVRSAALKPSDDSPFVNEIFDPSSVDNFFNLDSTSRKQCLRENKVTNYSVVRLPLLESLYEKLYRQNLLDRDQANWALRIFTERELAGIEILQPKAKDSTKARLRLRNVRTRQIDITDEGYDLVVLATGYQENTTSGVLERLQPLLDAPTPGRYSVDRNYRLRFLPGKMSKDAGVWLQGWCEDTHGLSDTLLSILSVRGAELLDSIIANSQRAKETARL